METSTANEDTRFHLIQLSCMTISDPSTTVWILGSLRSLRYATSCPGYSNNFNNWENSICSLGL